MLVHKYTIQYINKKQPPTRHDTVTSTPRHFRIYLSIITTLFFYFLRLHFFFYFLRLETQFELNHNTYCELYWDESVRTHIKKSKRLRFPIHIDSHDRDIWSYLTWFYVENFPLYIIMLFASIKFQERIIYIICCFLNLKND